MFKIQLITTYHKFKCLRHNLSHHKFKCLRHNLSHHKFKCLRYQLSQLRKYINQLSVNPPFTNAVKTNVYQFNGQAFP